MSSEQSAATLREQAMEALRQSTTMLEVASNLLNAGNRAEAVRLKDEARAKRNASVWLTRKANTLESATISEVLSRFQETRDTTSH